MIDFIRALEGWGIPLVVLIALVFIYVISLVIGTIFDACGKSAPVIINIRKWRKERKEEKKKKNNPLDDISATLKDLKIQQDEVKEFLNEVKKHYDEDNISKRDKWMLEVNSTMHWCRERAKTYDASVKELNDIVEVVKNQQQALEMNNKMTSEMFKQSCRRDILDFEHKIINARRAERPLIVSREEFRKIRKTYEGYEAFLETFGGTNGEVDDAMEVIRAAERGEYDYIEFLEDIRD